MALGFPLRVAYTEIAKKDDIEGSLPLVALIVVPFFGLKVAAILAVVLFFTTLAICWGICGWKIIKR